MDLAVRRASEKYRAAVIRAGRSTASLGRGENRV